MAENSRPTDGAGERDAALAAVAELSVKMMREFAALHERIDGLETELWRIRKGNVA